MRIPRGLACQPDQVVSLGEADATNTFTQPPAPEPPSPAATPVTATPTCTG